MKMAIFLGNQRYGQKGQKPKLKIAEISWQLHFNPNIGDRNKTFTQMITATTHHHAKIWKKSRLWNTIDYFPNKRNRYLMTTDIADISRVNYFSSLAS